MRFAWRCPESSRSVKNWNRKSRLSGVMFIIWRRNSTGWRKNWSTEPEKRKKKRKERQLEGEHGKGVMDEIRPEKWRIHPMEILIFALVIVAAVIILSRPWNYLVAIVLFLAFGLYVWNRMKVGKKQVKTEPEIILEEITQEEEKGSDREVTVGKGPYYRRTERKNNSV